MFKGNIVRYYTFVYATGDFGKSLLSSISEHGPSGAILGTHTMEYYKTGLVFGDTVRYAYLCPFLSIAYVIFQVGLA